MEDVVIFCGHLVHLTVFCYIFWTFGIVRGILEYFFPFWYFVPRKIWQPCTHEDRVMGETARVRENELLEKFSEALREISSKEEIFGEYLSCTYVSKCNC
jgi:hypothetical protein